MPPIIPTYPGVYVEEIPSGDRTIAGVPTSITAFVGRTPTGALDRATDCFNYGDFERHFGGRSLKYPLSYCIEDFFLNGGAHAIVVRAFHGDTAAKIAATAKFELGAAPPIRAIGPGKWGNALTIAFDRRELHTTPAEADLFNVTITYRPKDVLTVTERYTNVSVAGESPTRIDRVINSRSLLVVVNPDATAWDHFTAYDTVNGVEIQDPRQPVPSLTATGGDDSDPLEPRDFLGDELHSSAMYALENTDLFNLLCIPPDTRVVDEGGNGGDQDPAVWAEAAEFCAKRRAMLICDPPRSWKKAAESGQYSVIKATDLNVLTEDGGRNAAVFFPFIKKADLELDGRVEVFAPSGSVAGQFARTDLARGVWKAPAGLEAGLEGVTQPEVVMTDDQNGELNPLGINAIRTFPVVGTLIWGSRTLRGADVFSDDYKYIPVRRLTLYIEESLYRGTKWAVFEPNDERLWSQLRLSIGTFMADLSRQGALYGYSVTCDKSTTLQSDIDKGIVNVVVAFAPVKPAEFVVLRIAQLAGQTPG